MNKSKLFVLALSVVLLLSVPASAASPFDLSALTWEELLELKAAITIEQLSRDEWEEVEVPQGVYKVGEDIPAGKWTVRCKSGPMLFFAWGDRLDATGHDVDYRGVHDRANIANPNHAFFEAGYDTEYTFDAVSGYYIIVEDAPATFTPFAGKPDLGFKNNK